MSKISAGTIGIIFLIFFGSITYSFAEESLSWKSEYFVGILDSEIDELIPVYVSTFSEDSLKLDWEKPEVVKDKKIIGFEIFRKDLNSDYYKIEEITNSKKTSYMDMSLSEGYYGYKITPILQKIDSDKITMHGIDRSHDFFPTYMKGQQLIAEISLNQTCHRCFDESFEEIDNIFQYNFSNETKRTVKEYQFNLNSEILRTTQIFENLFKIRNNH